MTYIGIALIATIWIGATFLPDVKEMLRHSQGRALLAFGGGVYVLILVVIYGSYINSLTFPL